jgi:hypothetical protein
MCFRVQKCGDVLDLSRRQGKGWHSLLRASVPDYLADLVSLHIAQDNRGAHKIGAASSPRIRTVAEGTCCFERFPSSFYRRRILQASTDGVGATLLCRRLRLLSRN